MKIKMYSIDTRTGANKAPDPGVPFQKFYLVPGDVPPEQLRKLSPYSMIAPLVDQYKECLAKQGLDLTVLQTDGYKVMVPIHMIKVNEKDIGPTYLANKRFQLVRRYSKRGRRYYHRAKHWEQKIRSDLEGFLPESTILLTPDNVFQPPCLSCENNLAHLVGDCTLGSQICLDYMRLTPWNQMKDDSLVALKVPKGSDKANDNVAAD